MKLSINKSKNDAVKWFFSAFFIILAIIIPSSFFEQNILYKSLSFFLFISVFIVTALTTQLGRALISFIKESRTEVRKVVWPTRQETMQTTFIVVAVVLVMALLLWLIDSILFRIITVFTG